MNTAFADNLLKTPHQTPHPVPTRFVKVMITLFITLLFLVGLITFLLFFGIPGYGCSFSSAYIPVAAKTSPEMISRQLFDQYLESCTHPLTDGRYRLEEYQIDNISIASYRGTGFVFTVVFSVKPAVFFSNWIAGNGLARSDGWIERKFLFVHVVQTGGNYRIESLGTGP